MASLPPLPPPPAGGPDVPEPPASTAEPAGQPVGDGARTRSPALPVALALLLLGVVVAGALALFSWASAGSICDDGDFESVRFGYCARTPPGWIAAAAERDGTPLDRFLLQDGAATITVTAVPLTKGQDLARFEQFVRSFDEDAGATTGASSSIEVDGVEGVRFDATAEENDGVTRTREVLVAREGIAWRITLADGDVGFDASASRLDELLDSWRFT